MNPASSEAVLNNNSSRRIDGNNELFFSEGGTIAARFGRKRAFDGVSSTRKSY